MIYLRNSTMKPQLNILALSGTYRNMYTKNKNLYTKLFDDKALGIFSGRRLFLFLARF